jgi:hypothetical protein
VIRTDKDVEWKKGKCEVVVESQRARRQNYIDR